MANATFGTNIIPKTNAVTIGNSDHPWTIVNPTFTDAINMGRKSGSEVGDNSVAIGDSVSAIGDYSHAEGIPYTDSQDVTYYVIADGEAAHAEGQATVASGLASHSEGHKNTVTGTGSHAEGSNNTVTSSFSHAEGGSNSVRGNVAHAEGNSTQAINLASHSEGMGTIASGHSSHAEGYHTIGYGMSIHVSGRNNVPDSASHSQWISGSAYAVGDIVIYDNAFRKCYVANSDTEFDEAKWRWQTEDTVAEIVGNGTWTSERSNARLLDWNGNEYLNGMLYVNCNADSTGGSAVLAQGATWGDIAGVSV